MAFRNILNFHILWQEGIDPRMLYGVFSGIRNVLFLAGVANEIPLIYTAQRRQDDWCDKDGVLKPYQSLDWHIWLARRESGLAGCLNSTILLDSLKDNPDYISQPRYELVIVKEPIHLNKDGCLNTILGMARSGHGSVISLHNYLHLLQPVDGVSDEDRYKREFDFFIGTQNLAEHEVGHTLGLYIIAPINPNPTIEQIKASHCLEDCVMYGPYDTEMENRIAGQPFCSSCLKKLKEFFIEP